MSVGAVPYPIIPPQAAFERHVSTPGDESGRLSPEQQGNFNERGGLEQQQAETIERERKQQADADKIEAQHKQNAADAMQAIDDEKARRDVELQKNIGEWQNRLEGSYTKAQTAPPPSLFADQTTGQKALRGFGLLLAGIGDVIAAGANARYGTAKTNAFGEIVEADLTRQREKIAKMRDDVLMARTGVKDAQEARKIALGELDAKGAGFMKRLEAIASSRLANLKETDQGFIPAQKALAAAKEERLKYQQASLAPLTIKHQDPTVSTTTRETDQVQKPVQPGTEDINKTADLDNGIQNAESMIADLKSRPHTWNEVRDNQEGWGRAEAVGSVQGLKQVRALAQGVGAADISQDQGLRAASPEAKSFFQKQERLTNALGKEALGVMTVEEKKIANSMQGNLALNTKEKIDALQAGVDLMKRKREAYTVNRGVKPSGAPTLVPSAPTPGKNDVPPAAPPPGRKEGPRERAVRLLKAGVSTGGPAADRALRQHFNITDEDLR